MRAPTGADAANKGMIVANIFRLAALLLALMAPSSAWAEWREAETPHFRIFSEGGDARLLRFAERLEMLDTLLRKATGTPADLPPTKVRIILFDNVEQVQQAFRRKGKPISGFYTVNMHGPMAVAPRRDGDESILSLPEIILFHEYAHHFLLQYAPGSYPAWYTEGFAEIASTAATMPGGKMAWGKPAEVRQYSLTTSRWVPVRTLLSQTYSSFPADADFYGQSWLLAHYLTFSQERAGQLRRYLGLLAAGRPHGDAAVEAFGDLDVLNNEVRQYLSNGSFPYRAVPIEPPARSSFTLRTLGPGEAALMRETAAFRDDVKEEDRASWLAGFRSKAARFPTDPYVLRMLADAEYAAEDYAAARATADRLLAVAPDDVRGLTRKGMVLLREAEDLEDAERTRKVEEARKLILAANKKDPDDPYALVAYYESFRISGERAPAVAVEGLRQAVGTIPQDFRPRMLLATQLANEGKLAEAVHFLGPIAYDPHPSEGQAAALALVQQLRQAIAASKKR